MDTPSDMGKVLTTLTVTNRIDEAKAKLGILGHLSNNSMNPSHLLRTIG